MLEIKKNLSKLFTKNNLGFMILGLSSGITSPLTSSTLYAKLVQNEISNTIIGFFSILLSIHGLKFLLSPFIGKFSIKFLDKILDHAKSEILLIQFIIISLLIIIGIIDPKSHILLLFIATGCTVVFIALYDLRLDTLRIEIMQKQDQPSSASAAIAGYRVGNIISGGLFLMIVDFLQHTSDSIFFNNHSWPFVYCLSAAIILISFGSAWLIPTVKSSTKQKRQFSVIKEFRIPIRNFMQNHSNWLAIVICLMLFEFGDSLVETMMYPFLIETGFSLTQIGFVVKTFGIFSALVGGIAGSFMINHYKEINSLYIAGLMQMMTNFLFLLQFYLGKNIYMLYIMIGFEDFAQGIGYIALISYISSICNKKYLTTQYSILLSIPFIGKYMLSSTAGFIVDYCGGWLTLFILSIVCCLPSQIIIRLVLQKQENKNKASLAISI